MGRQKKPASERKAYRLQLRTYNLIQPHLERLAVDQSATPERIAEQLLRIGLAEVLRGEGVDEEEIQRFLDMP